MADESIRLTLDTQQFLASASSGAASVKTLKTATDELDHTVKKAEGSTRNLGYAGLTAGRAIQDFAQGGIGGILNNIEGLTTALGGTAGLAGALTAVGVAAFIMKPWIEQMWKALNGDAEAIEQGTAAIKERIKAIEDKPIKLAVDTKELAAAQKQLKDYETAVAAFERIRESRTEKQQKTSAMMEKVLTEANQPELSDEIKARVVEELEKSPEMQKSRDDFTKAAHKAEELRIQTEALAKGGGSEEAVAGLQSRLQTAEKQANAAKEALDRRQTEIRKKSGTAEAVVGHATDLLKRGGLATEMAGLLRGAGETDRAEMLEGATPEAQRDLARHEQRLAETRKARHAAGAKRFQDAEEQKQAAAAAGAEQKASVAKRDAVIERKGKLKDIDREARARLAPPRPRPKPRNIRERLARAKDRRTGATFDEAMEAGETGRLGKGKMDRIQPAPSPAVAGRMVEITAENLKATQATQRAVETNQNATGFMIQQARQATQNAQRLNSNAERLMREAAAANHAMTNQNNGGGMR